MPKTRTKSSDSMKQPRCVAILEIPFLDGHTISLEVHFDGPASDSFIKDQILTKAANVAFKTWTRPLSPGSSFIMTYENGAWHTAIDGGIGER